MDPAIGAYRSGGGGVAGDSSKPSSSVSDELLISPTFIVAAGGAGRACAGRDIYALEPAVETAAPEKR